MKQATFESLAWRHKGKVIRREQFLAEMDAVIPWKSLIVVAVTYLRHRLLRIT